MYLLFVQTGGDGCICYLEYNGEQQTVEFVGMRHLKELSLIQSLSANHCSLDDSENISYAVGFSSTDFSIWNLHSETKVFLFYVSLVNCFWVSRDSGREKETILGEKNYTQSFVENQECM